MALGAVGEDVQDQAGAVGDGAAEMLFEVALLSRAQGLIEDDAMRRGRGYQGLDLVGLAAADEERRVGGAATRDDPRRDHVAGRSGQQRQLVERGIEGSVAADVHAHEHRPCAVVAARGDGGFSGTQGGDLPARAQACSPGSLAWKFTARLGTTVEMACL